MSAYAHGVATSLKKSAFVNIDARVRCPTDDCWGDLLLLPDGTQDGDGIPHFQPYTACPLCGAVFQIDDDVSDRDLYLKVAWMRANPHADESQ